MTFDTTTNLIIIEATHASQVGFYDIDARVYLEDYPDIEALTSFKVHIDHC